MTLSEKEMRRIAMQEIARRLDRADENDRAIVRAAQLLDYVHLYHFLLPYSAEFDRLLLEHAKFVEKRRRLGELPAAKTIKRPVSKPKARKSEVT